MSHPDRGPTLLAIARDELGRRLDGPRRAHEPAAWLREPGASFVTLLAEGRLRGCVGSVEARRPLEDDVRHAATGAAFRDDRFQPVVREELAELTVEVSVLSPAAPLHFADRADALGRLVPGRDGLVLECGVHRATFLPQVWEQLPEAEEFLGRLMEKAGLRRDAWPADLHLSRYTVDKWSEATP